MSPRVRRKIQRGSKRSAVARSGSNSQRIADAVAHSFIGGHYSGQIFRALTFVHAAHSISCAAAGVTRSFTAAILATPIGGSNGH